jgi:hypothetical protein
MADEGGRRLVMSAQFWPCPACARHVKRGDATCPFCGATASVVENRQSRTIAGRLSRAALFAAGTVGAAVATTNCASMYGAPPGSEIEDSSASDSPSSGAPNAADASAPTMPTDSSSAADVPMAVPFYGAAML